MNHHLAVLVLFAISLSTEVTRSAFQEEQPRRWVMRRPADFPDVPQAIRRQLEQQQCRIPQAPGWRIRHNVVWGEFERNIGHDGVEDVFACCSTVYYRHNGRWLRAPGAD